MLKEQKDINSLEYQKLSKEEMQSRGILGRLIGCCADFIIPTRNGRKYSEKLWEKVFSDDIVKEKFDNKVFYGELGHPADREEVDIEKVAVCMAEMPKKGKDGKLRAVFDILNTPNGRLLKTLCDYGSTLGISSRGTGDVEEDINGEECVVEDTYQCEAFDVVILPAVKSARLQYVTESLDKNKVSLKEALNNTLKEATDEERAVMQSTLDTLDIDVNSEDEEADDNGSEILKQLQEALLENKKLQSELISLNEKLSVSYTKEATLSESLDKSKRAAAALVNTCKQIDSIKSSNASLNEQLNTQKEIIADKEAQIAKLTEKITKVARNSFTLSESIKSKDKEISLLNEQIERYTCLLNKSDMQKKEIERSLNESIDMLKKDSALQQKQYAKKLTETNSLVERYKKIGQQAVSKYINLQASRIGVSVNEIRNKLPESYNFDDIDRICESMQEYKLNISKLPFNVFNNAKVKITESKSPICPINQDDQIDDELLRIAGLK